MNSLKEIIDHPVLTVVFIILSAIVLFLIWYYFFIARAEYKAMKKHYENDNDIRPGELDQYFKKL